MMKNIIIIIMIKKINISVLSVNKDRDISTAYCYSSSGDEVDCLRVTMCIMIVCCNWSHCSGEKLKLFPEKSGLKLFPLQLADVPVSCCVSWSLVSTLVKF